MIGKGKRTGNNFGKQLDEVIDFKEKAKLNVRKSGKDYAIEATRLASYVNKKLEKCLEKLADEKNTEETNIALADEIYQALVETNLTSLEKSKEDYDFWFDWNEKFNS